MSDLNWLGKAFFKPKAGKSLARSVIVTVVAVALVLGVGLVPITPLTETAQANGGGQTPQTLNVAQWDGPTTTGVSGRETVLKVGNTYHMWYSPSDSVIKYTYSTDPDSFEAGTQCNFTDGNPAGVDSVSVVKEGNTFYMIAYGSTDKVFNIYTSTDGTAWVNGGVVFDGTDKFTDFGKVDAPFLFHEEGLNYRLYFQVKNEAGTRYDIYAAESSTIGGTYTLVNGGNPVLSPATDSNAWDGKYVMHPWVVKDGDVYYMWYSAHNGNLNQQRLGMAKSTDGLNWVKSPGNPILPDPTAGYAEPSVIKDGNTWRMWLIARADSVVTSGDGVVYYDATGPFEFQSIQDAIDEAESGDTINVAPGEYTEESNSVTDSVYADIVVNENNITVKALNPASTLSEDQMDDPSKASIIIASGEKEHVVNIAANDVTFDGFTVKWNSSSPTEEENTNKDTNEPILPIGIYVGNFENGATKYSNCFITQNYVSGFDSGIFISSGSSHKVDGNIVTENGGGIVIREFNDDDTNDTDKIIVTNNTCNSNYAGIRVLYTKKVNIENNTCYSNDRSIDLSNSNEITIKNNNITNNNKRDDIDTAGVYIDQYCSDININLNNIYNNSSYGVFNDSTNSTIDARYNWWGDPSGPYDNKKLPGTPNYNNPLGTGDAVSANVDFNPWLIFNNTLPIISTDPVDGATNVGIYTPLNITFAEGIKAKDYVKSVAVSHANEINKTYNGNNVLTITPAVRWAFSTKYTVTISSSLENNSLPNEYSFSFTTVPAPSGGGGGGVTPTPTPPSAVEPVSDSVVNNAIEEAEETGQVTIEVNKEETALTIEQLEQIADTDKPAVIKTEEVEFVLPPEVVADLAETDAVQIEITAEKVAADETPTPPSGFQLAGEVFELTIAAIDEEGNKDEISGFTKAITITLPVPASAKDAAVAGKLDVYRYNETTKTWEAMGGIYDEATNTIIFTTDHLSKYALLEGTALPTKTFADIKGHWAQSDIEIMAGLGIVGGISENEFAPQMPVNRAQFAAFLIRSLDIKEVKPAESHFKDVPTNAWYYGAVEGAYAAGLVGGYEDGTFKPEKEISRQEIAALIARALKNEGEEVTVDDVDSILARFKDASKISPWAKEEAAQAVASGIIVGRDGLFAPQDNTKRAEAVVMLKRMLVKLGVI